MKNILGKVDRADQADPPPASGPAVTRTAVSGAAAPADAAAPALSPACRSNGAL